MASTFLFTCCSRALTIDNLPEKRLSGVGTPTKEATNSDSVAAEFTSYQVMTDSLPRELAIGVRYADQVIRTQGLDLVDDYARRTAKILGVIDMLAMIRSLSRRIIHLVFIITRTRRFL